MLFAFDGVKGATMSNLRMRNPPNVRYSFLRVCFQGTVD